MKALCVATDKGCLIPGGSARSRGSGEVAGSLGTLSGQGQGVFERNG